MPSGNLVRAELVNSYKTFVHLNALTLKRENVYQLLLASSGSKSEKQTSRKTET
jgi:hypothetical protein